MRGIQGPVDWLRPRRLVPLLLLVLVLLAMRTSILVKALQDSHHGLAEDPALCAEDEDLAMVMEQFEKIDRFLTATARPAGRRKLAEMTEEELEEELRCLMQAMHHPAPEVPSLEIDLTEFNAHHDQIAQVLDPHGNHRRALEASDRPRSSRSRRLSIFSLVSSGVYSIREYVNPLNEKSEKASAGDFFNIFLSFKPYRCKWRHLDYTPEARAAFERCTGVAAAVAQIERVNFNIWLISMLLSPSGMGFFVIGKVIDYALAKSCNSYVEETPNQRAAFWNDNEIAYDNLSFFEKIGFTWRNLDKAKVVEYVRDYVLGPIYNVLRFLGKLGIKQFESAAKQLRPWMSAGRQKEEKLADFCEKKSRFQRYIRRILMLREILDDIWSVLRNDLKDKLATAPCRQFNTLALSFEQSGYNASHFPVCSASCSVVKAAWENAFGLDNTNYPPPPCTGDTKAPTRAPTAAPRVRRYLNETMDGHRALSPATFDFAGAATLIYDKHWLGTDEVLKYLAIFHDWDEALLEAWTDSGIEEGLQVLAGIISYYENIWSTIGRIFQAALGEFLEFAKSIIDKLGQYICDTDSPYAQGPSSGPPPDCGLVGVIIAFVKATVNTVLSFIDGAVDYLTKLLVEQLINAIGPQLKSLFEPFNFGRYYDELVGRHIARVNASMVEMFDEISNTLSLDRLSPQRDMAKFLQSVVAPATVLLSRETYERIPRLSFTCTPGFIPVVMTLEYKADNCDLDLGPSYRFPCFGMDHSCDRDDLDQYVRSCYSEVPVNPPDFLPNNYAKYQTLLNYICFDTSKPLSVLGELIRYPSSGTLNDAFGNFKFEGALSLPVSQYAAAYPDMLRAGFDTVIYMEHVTLPNDLCFSELWQRTPPANLPEDFRYKWWLCYFLRKYGYGNITLSTTGSALGQPNTTSGKINAMKQLLLPKYTEWNTCMYVQVGDNTPTFVATYPGVAKQVNCDATAGNNGATAGPFVTNCDVSIVGGTGPAGTNYWDTHVNRVRYTCQDSDGYYHRITDGLGGGATIIAQTEDGWRPCIASECWRSCVGGHCCAGFRWDVGNTADNLVDCDQDSGRSCLTRTVVGWGLCPQAGDQWAFRATEVDKKFATLHTWLDARTSCADALQSCTGQKTCDLSGCKPQNLEFIYTNQLAPHLSNTGVRFAFYGGMKQQADPTYTERLTCARPDMRPQLVTLEASWGVFTSYGFDVTEIPLVPASGGNSAYYSINPTDLRNRLVADDGSLASKSTITFRAEYKCLCPPGYQSEPLSFNNVSSCTACTNGFYRSEGMLQCESCPAGTYEDGTHTRCLPCPAGTYNNVTGQYINATSNSSVVGCLACPLLQVSSPGSTHCFDCWQKDPRTGEYFPDGGGPNTWAAANNTCLPCPENLFTNVTLVNVAGVGCSRCPKGYYRGSGMLDCIPAPPGMYMNDEGEGRDNASSRRLLRDDPDFADASLRKRTLVYLVHNMRRYLENAANDTSTFPIPSKLLPCSPGTYNPVNASATCLVCPAGSYQPLQGQSRCEACRFGFTTRDLGAVNASACIPIAEALRNPSNNSGLFESFNNSVVSANAVSYASNMTCEEFLTAYGNINDLGYRGDGICNPGLLNTPNCGYDGGDCCAQTCKPGGAVPALTASDLNDLSEILKYTNDTQVIAAISQPIKGIEDFTITYTYGCSPFSFDCRDPAVLSQPLNCSAPKPPTPEVETYLNASCGNYELDPAYGDGFCDARLNFFECNYDGGDCCPQTCRLNRFNGRSCAPSTFNCRDPRSNITTAGYVNPPKVFQECYPFFYDNDFRDLRVLTVVTTNPDPCVSRNTSVEQLADTYIPGPVVCPGNITLLRQWNITDLATMETSTRNQTVYISTTTPPQYQPRPAALWRNASTRARPFYFGKLQTSPFFGFGEADLCTGAVTVAFVSCVNVAAGGGSSATCTYDTASDELTLSALENGDLWKVTVQLVDACNNANTVATTVPVLVSVAAPLPANMTASSVAAALPTEVVVNNASFTFVEASPWYHALVSSRLPLLQNRLTAPTAQVCTEVQLYATPPPPQLPQETMLAPYQQPPGVQLCLAVTRTPVQCAESATSGRLRAIFLDTAGAFGLSSASNVSTVDASIAIAGRCEGTALTACGNWSLNFAELNTMRRPYNLALLINDTAWQGTGEKDIGCFYLRGFNLTRTTSDMDLALVYSDVNGAGGLISMGLNQVATATPPPLDPPNTPRAVISTKAMPNPEGQARAHTGLACLRVEPRVVDVSTTAICLFTTTQYPGCVSSATSGSLQTIYVDPAAMGLPNSFMYTFESGHDNVFVNRPYCVRENESKPLSCDARVPEPPRIAGRHLLVGIPVNSSQARWSSADQFVGCLYATYPDWYGALSARRRSLAGSSVDSGYYNWSLAFRLQTPAGPSFMAGQVFTNAPNPQGNGVPLSSRCARNTLTVRAPQGDNEGTTTLVCTTVEVQLVDSSTLEVRLHVNSTLPQCVSSSTQGRLRALFFDTTAFGGLPPTDLSFQDGTIRLDPNVCTEIGPNIPLKECNGQSVWGLPSGGANSTYFNVGLTVANPNEAAWNGTRSASLGSFYVKNFNGIALTPPSEGWSVGLVYSDTDGGTVMAPNRAVGAARLCTRSPQVPTQPCGPLDKRVISESWKGQVSKGDPDIVYTLPGKVCAEVELTRIDVRTLRVCLAATNAALGCRTSATSGRLAGVFFSSKPFGVADAWELNVENGTIQFQTPYCTTRTRGPGKGIQRVDRCGAPWEANSLRLGKSKPSFQLDVGLTVANNVSWSGAGDAKLGCFYITGPADQPDSVIIKNSTNKWSQVQAFKYKRTWHFALRFQDVSGKAFTSALAGNKTFATSQPPTKKRSYAIMLGSVCFDDGQP